jgi:hypothetical protein
VQPPNSQQFLSVGELGDSNALMGFAATAFTSMTLDQFVRSSRPYDDDLHYHSRL